MDRKADTRRKIQLGGLIVKANLDYMHPHEVHVLYGMLLDCQRSLELRPELKYRWAELGSELFFEKTS